MRIALVSSVMLSTLLAATVAHGKTILVPPGPGTPVQDAIDAASDGDTIRLTLGAYPEHLFINAAIKLRGVRSTSVAPNGTTLVGEPCGSGTTITIFAAGAQLRGIQVLGGLQGGVDVRGGSNRIKLTDVFVSSHCDNHLGAPLVNVEQSSRVKLIKVWAAGSLVQQIPAGIRIADTPQDGQVRVSKSAAGHNEIGVLLENNGINSVRLSAGDFNFNHRGIVLRGTSRAVVDHNELVDNPTSGIELDATSSANTIVRNVVSGSASDVLDAGTANCWRNNTFQTGSVAACQ